MRIAVLEWICGGGLAQQSSSAMTSALQAEGQAMLRTLLNGIGEAGFAAACTLDERLKNRLPETSSMECEFIPRGASTEHLLNSWRLLAEACDWTIVVAPESEGILERVIALLEESARPKLVNCRGAGLRLACNKVKFAEFCGQAGIAHPATCRLSDVDEEWLEVTTGQFGNVEWAVKPLDGAGCDALQRLTRTQLESCISEFWRLAESGVPRPAPASRLPLDCVPTGEGSGEGVMEPAMQLSRETQNALIIQPWVAGQAFSCACIVDRDSRWHWLPLQEQSLSSGGRPKYLGGQFAEIVDVAQADRLLDALASQLEQQYPGDFRGWLGVDLVYDANADKGKQWTVIEINPRCTTSIVGLARAFRGRTERENLAAFLIRSQADANSTLHGTWVPTAYAADGATRRMPKSADRWE